MLSIWDVSSDIRYVQGRSLRILLTLECQHATCMFDYLQPCRQYSNRYVADEEAAKKAKLGLWAGEVSHQAVR
jgi:endonuclease YncB( thermonuclease family)